MIYQVLASGSAGNAVLYHDSILVDIGIPYTLLKPFIYKIQIVLLTHEHADHLNLATLKKLTSERPALRIACGEFLADKLQGIKNIDILEIGNIYDYGHFSVSPVKLFHDVPNFGYRIFKNDYKIFHATDTEHLRGITANGYDLYALEHSYDEDVIIGIIQRKQDNDQYSYEKSVINSHLSEQQARQFIFDNAGEKYEVLRLHESQREYSELSTLKTKTTYKNE